MIILEFSEKAWRFPFIRACVMLIIVGFVVIHTAIIFGLSVDLVLVGFLFASVWSLVIAYSVFAFPEMWRKNWDVEPLNREVVVSQDTVFCHKSLVGVCESRRLVKFSFAVYIVFVVTRSVFIDKINYPLFFIGLLIVLYVTNTVRVYWANNEKMMWLKFIENEYERSEVK